MYLIIHNILSLVVMDSYQSFISTVKETNEEISATSAQQPEAQVSKEWPNYTCPFCEKRYHQISVHWQPSGEIFKFKAVMKQKNDEVDEALEELGKFDEMQEENDRLNASLAKIKGKHGEIDIEELLDTERELQELTKEFQLQSKEIEKIMFGPLGVEK